MGIKWAISATFKTIWKEDVYQKVVHQFSQALLHIIERIRLWNLPNAITAAFLSFQSSLTIFVSINEGM